MALAAPLTGIHRTNAKTTYPYPVPYSANNMSAATAAAAAAQVSVNADGGKGLDGGTVLRPLVISQVWWNYNGAPTGGRVTLADSGGTYYDVTPALAGPGQHTFTPPILCGSTSALTATLAAAGAAVTGTIGLVCWRQD